MKIGIISDTHNDLDPAVLRLFEGVEHILHGGDVGLMSIIYALEGVAPVTAVFGNTDTGLPLEEIKVVELAGRKFLLCHIVEPRSPHESLRARLALERPDVVVFGHTHKPFEETIDGTLFFNPGYAGKQRFRLPRSVALMEIGKGGIRTQINWL
jgi:uncharacterized protein